MQDPVVHHRPLLYSANCWKRCVSYLLSLCDVACGFPHTETQHEYVRTHAFFSGKLAQKESCFASVGHAGAVRRAHGNSESLVGALDVPAVMARCSCIG